MTRINAGIPVEKLSDQHLLAEHREIKRIPNTKFTGKVPERFTLGKGHVLFFSDKHLYTLDRYIKLHYECQKRGFNVGYYADSWECIYGEYIPNKEDARKVVERLVQRTLESKTLPRIS